MVVEKFFAMVRKGLRKSKNVQKSLFGRFWANFDCLSNPNRKILMLLHKKDPPSMMWNDVGKLARIVGSF